jgi:hypothetical protein
MSSFKNVGMMTLEITEEICTCTIAQQPLLGPDRTVVFEEMPDIK